LIYHVTKSFDPLPLKTVTVEPCIQNEINKESLKIILPQKGYNDVNVEVSNTPIGDDFLRNNQIAQ